MRAIINVVFQGILNDECNHLVKLKFHPPTITPLVAFSNPILELHIGKRNSFTESVKVSHLDHVFKCEAGEKPLVPL